MRADTPIDYNVVKQAIASSQLPQVGNGTIREIVRLVNEIERESGQRFIRMEMGVPGLPACQLGIEAEIEALKQGVAASYAPIEGIPSLKKEIAHFAKLFLNITIDEEGCIPTVGAMQGAFLCFLVANRTDRTRVGTLFLDPGFPVQKQQQKVMGHDYVTFDIYNFRGEKLREKLESYLKAFRFSTILYSNPNNPSWVCFNQDELRIIAELADRYGVIVIEDLAYFGMDFRQNYARPGQAPYQPTIAHYTDNYILLISSSKVFSYAGQRIGMMLMSDELFNRRYPDLKRYYTSDRFGYSVIYGALYALTAGVSHSSQYALAAMLKAVNEGTYNFIKDVKAYEERAQHMKNLFAENGFNIVYDNDMGAPLADGFYFTLSYPGFTGPELIERLLYYGVSAIALNITGSSREEGIRACVSQTGMERMDELAQRLKLFHKHHSENLS